MQTLKLGSLLLRLYEILGEDLPNRVRPTEPITYESIQAAQKMLVDENAYSRNVRTILESNGWFQTKEHHWAWQNIEFNISNEVVIFLHNNPLMSEWKLGIGFFAPWSTDWDASMKFGYLKALGLEPKLKEIDFSYGRPVCFLEITPRMTEISLWQPRLLSDKFQTILSSILKELPEDHLLSDPTLYRKSGWYGHDALRTIACNEERTWKESDPVYLSNRRCGVHKIVTDTEVFYVLFEHGSGQFNSKAYDTAEEVAAEAIRLNLGDTYEAWFEAARNTSIIHNARRFNIFDAVSFCSQLKLGNALAPEQARVVQGFFRFLYALVEHHGESYEELDAQMKSCIKKLRLKLDENGDWQDLVYQATDVTFGETYRDKVRTKPSEKISTIRKRKLAGLYVSKLAMIARIAGPNRLSVTEMIDQFRASSQNI